MRELGDLEPFEGSYDWQEAFRQNPGEPVYDVPLTMQIRIHGLETTAQADVRARAMQRRRFSDTSPFGAIS